MAYKEFESERYSKVIEIEKCSYIASDFDPEAGYKCPDVKVEIAFNGTPVSFMYNQSQTGNSKIKNIDIAADSYEAADIEDCIRENISDLCDLIEDSDEYHAAIDKYDRMFSNAMANREAVHDDNFDRYDSDERENNSREVAYEDDKIKITETGRDYDAVAIIENKTDEEIVLFVDGDFEFARIDAGDYVGLTNSEYDELNEFLSYDSVEVKTADEMEQENNALVNKYKYGIDR